MLDNCLGAGVGVALFPFPLALGRRARKGQINRKPSQFLKQASVSASNGEEEKKGDSGAHLVWLSPCSQDSQTERGIPDSSNRSDS